MRIFTDVINADGWRNLYGEEVACFPSTGSMRLEDLPVELRARCLPIK